MVDFTLLSYLTQDTNLNTELLFCQVKEKVQLLNHSFYLASLFKCVYNHSGDAR